MIRIGKALFDATEEMERERGISKEIIIDSLCDAMVAAYKKHIKDKEANNVEAILGPSARVAVSNTDAFEGMSWDVDMRNDIVLARSRVREIPEIPGSYYLSRAIDHCFWNVVNSNKKPKNMLSQWGAEVDTEIERKWEQYTNRK